jgi:hypothetical protein
MVRVEAVFGAFRQGAAFAIRLADAQRLYLAAAEAYGRNARFAVGITVTQNSMGTSSFVTRSRAPRGFARRSALATRATRWISFAMSTRLSTSTPFDFSRSIVICMFVAFSSTSFSRLE